MGLGGRMNIETCEWVQQEMGFYDTECKGVFFFWEESTIEDYGFIFCPFCGKKIEKRDNKGE